MSEERKTSVDKENAATIAAIASFVVGLVGAIAFIVVYLRGPDALPGMFTQALGLCVALAVGGLGAGLVFWAHGLMPQGPDVEDREFPAPDPQDRRRFMNALEEQTKKVGRRGLLGRLLLLAGGVTGVAALFPLGSLGPTPFPRRTRTGWREDVRVVTEEGEPVHVDSLDFNSVLTVFPEGRVREADSQAVLLRVPLTILKTQEGREDWSPEGYVAYSKLCTHAGCPVGLYQSESQRLFCPCHQSAFDVTDGARPTFGPATRSLPQLPLGLNDAGELIALGDFPEPVGPGFWTLPSAEQDER